MRISSLAVVPLAAMVLTGCSLGSLLGMASPAPAGPHRIEVTLSDAMRIEPDPMTVPADVPVTFAVTNTGTVRHEFFLGDEAAQEEHEREMSGMSGMSGMAHDEPMGVTVEPGATKELTVTISEAREIIAGCHEPGHYAAGMRAVVEVVA